MKKMRRRRVRAEKRTVALGWNLLRKISLFHLCLFAPSSSVLFFIVFVLLSECTTAIILTCVLMFVSLDCHIWVGYLSYQILFLFARVKW
jgi:hypothetical protein